MKLSEILGWPEKKEFVASDVFKEIDSFKDGFNTALTYCDREIDREALAKSLYESAHPYDDWEDAKSFYLTKADLFISTMPTWLKPTERK